MRQVAVTMLAALAWLAAVPLAHADPALWLARGPHATVYLFGSVHALPAGTTWRNAAFDRAFDSADSCWFEIDLAKVTPADAAAALASLGHDPDHRLADLLPPDDARLLHDRGAAMKLPDAALDTMRPWFAAVIISISGVLKDGLDPAEGVDAILQAAAAAAGKPIHGLETPEDQLRGLAAIPDATAIKLLQAILHADPLKPFSFAGIVRAWQAADLDTLADALSVRSDATVALFDATFATRNAAWSTTIAGLLNGEGTTFVTVGAGHLVGPGNLRELLQRRGYTVERVPD